MWVIDLFENGNLLANPEVSARVCLDLLILVNHVALAVDILAVEPLETLSLGHTVDNLDRLGSMSSGNHSHSI